MPSARPHLEATGLSVRFGARNDRAEIEQWLARRLLFTPHGQLRRY